MSLLCARAQMVYAANNINSTVIYMMLCEWVSTINTGVIWAHITLYWLHDKGPQVIHAPKWNEHGHSEQREPQSLSNNGNWDCSMLGERLDAQDEEDGVCECMLCSFVLTQPHVCGVSDWQGTDCSVWKEPPLRRSRYNFPFHVLQTVCLAYQVCTVAADHSEMNAVHDRGHNVERTIGRTSLWQQCANKRRPLQRVHQPAWDNHEWSWQSPQWERKPAWDNNEWSPVDNTMGTWTCLGHQWMVSVATMRNNLWIILMVWVCDIYMDSKSRCKHELGPHQPSSVIANSSRPYVQVNDITIISGSPNNSEPVNNMFNKGYNTTFSEVSGGMPCEEALQRVTQPNTRTSAVVGGQQRHTPHADGTQWLQDTRPALYTSGGYEFQYYTNQY